MKIERNNAKGRTGLRSATSIKLFRIRFKKISTIQRRNMKILIHEGSRYNARPLLSHALEDGNFEALVDPRLENNFDQGEMFRMIEAAAACVRHSAQRRPRMGQVVRALESDAAMADLNNGVKPGQSTMYNSAQYSADIRRFRRMAFGSQDIGSDFSGVSSEYDINPSTSSGECHKSKEVEAKRSRHLKTDFESASGSEYPSSESETRPINTSHSHKEETGERSSGELRTNFRIQPLKGR